MIITPINKSTYAELSPLTNTRIQSAIKDNHHTENQSIVDYQAPPPIKPSRHSQISRLIKQDKLSRVSFFKKSIVEKRQEMNVMRTNDLINKRRKAHELRGSYLEALNNSKRFDHQRKMREAQHVREQIKASQKILKNSGSRKNSFFKNFDWKISKYNCYRDITEQSRISEKNQAYRKIKTDILKNQQEISQKYLQRLRALEQRHSELSRKIGIY